MRKSVIRWPIYYKSQITEAYWVTVAPCLYTFIIDLASESNKTIDAYHFRYRHDALVFSSITRKNIIQSSLILDRPHQILLNDRNWFKLYICSIPFPDMFVSVHVKYVVVLVLFTCIKANR